MKLSKGCIGRQRLASCLSLVLCWGFGCTAISSRTLDKWTQVRTSRAGFSCQLGMVPEALSSGHISLSLGCRQICYGPVDLRRALDLLLAPRLYNPVLREDVGYRAPGLGWMEEPESDLSHWHLPSYALALRGYVVPSASLFMTIWIWVPLLWCQGSLEIQV